MQNLQLIEPAGLSAPGGHYSHGVAFGGVLYISGQLGRAPGMTDEEAGDIATQTRRALTNVASVARAAGTDLAGLLKVNVYISDVALWPAVNAEYSLVLGGHRPARAVIPVSALHHGALVEIDAIAALPAVPVGPPWK